MTANAKTMDITHIWGSPEAEEARRLEKEAALKRQKAVKLRQQRERRRREVLEEKKISVELRRARVTSYLASGHSSSEILALLEEEGIRVGKGKRITLSVIDRDKRWIKKQWREETEQSIEEHRQRQLQELEVLKHEAWKAGDRNIVLREIEKQSELLGTKRATEKSSGGTVNVRNQYTQVNLISEDERDTRLAELLESARERRVAAPVEDRACLDAPRKAKARVR